MKNGWNVLVAAPLIIILMLQAGCSSTLSARSPEETFNNIYKACMKGQYEKAHELYSRRLRQAIPLAKLKEEYSSPEMREKMKAMMKDSSFRVDRVALVHAFAEVRWSDDTVQKLTFVMEDGVWKLDITGVATD